MTGERGGRTGRLLGRALVAVLTCALVVAAAAPAAKQRAPHADLTVRSAAVKLDAGRVSATLVAVNGGRRRAGASTGELSWKPAGGPVVTVLARFRVPALAPGGRRAVNVTAAVPAGASGAFLATVCLDVRGQVRERSGKNNCRAAGNVTVRPGATPGAVRTSPSTSGSSTPPGPAPAPAPPPVGDGAPETSIGRGPVGTTNDRTATFLLTASETGALFACRIDAGPWAWCTSPAVFSSLPDGSHTFEVRATGAAGVSDQSPASRSWTVDGTAPQTTITAGPAALVGAGAATLEFTSSEPGGSFECRVDTGAWGFCDSPKDVTGLVAGPHTFQVRATDAAGNRDATPASRAWTVDLTAPNTSLGPSAGTTGPSTAFTFTSTKAGSFECRLDDGSWAACTSPVTYTGLADGAHTLRVRALDGLGNVDATPAERTWTVDATAPETVMDAGPTGTVAVTTATLMFSSPDPGATFECRLDGGAWAACTSPASRSGITDGSHTFEVRAVDGFGNADQTPAPRTWVVDTQAPETTIESGPSGTVDVGTADIAFSSSEPGGSFECRLDDGPWAACVSPAGRSGLANGPHTFDVRAIDVAGNADATPATRTWTVALQP